MHVRAVSFLWSSCMVLRAHDGAPHCTRIARIIRCLQPRDVRVPYVQELYKTDQKALKWCCCLPLKYAEEQVHVTDKIETLTFNANKVLRTNFTQDMFSMSVSTQPPSSDTAVCAARDLLGEREM